MAVINEFFARKVFGSPRNAVGGYFKNREGTRLHVVGMVEDGKYSHITEDPQPAMFLPILQAPTSSTWFVVRSGFDSQQISSAVRKTLRSLDASLPVYVNTWGKGLDLSLFPARMAAISLGVLGLMGAMLSVTGIFGMAAYSVSKRLRELGIRMALGAQRKRSVARSIGTLVPIACFRLGLGLTPWDSRKPRFGSYRVSGNSP